jgi:hypothetical protein
VIFEALADHTPNAVLIDQSARGLSRQHPTIPHRAAVEPHLAGRGEQDRLGQIAFETNGPATADIRGGLTAHRDGSGLHSERCSYDAPAPRPQENDMATALHPPQLITAARMLYLVWIPEDPDGAVGLLPPGLTAAERTPCYINQYVVDDERQVSNTGSPDAFGAYSLTYLGIDLAGLDTETGTPGRFWTHYLNSSEPMRRYALAHGVPATPGRTVLELTGDTAVATTYDGDRAIIRTEARARVGTPVRTTGQLRYITRVDGQLVSGRYAYVADLAETFEVTSFQFLDPGHPVYQLRPASPLEITFGFYSPAISFVYPGGEGALGSEHGR